MSISHHEHTTLASGNTIAGSALRSALFGTAHELVRAEKASSMPGTYTLKFFSPHQYETLRSLCQMIIPADLEAGGAIEAAVPEVLDLVASENREFQTQLDRGIMWLDRTCVERYGQSYLKCGVAQQREILDLIAFRRNGEKDKRLVPEIEFFSTLRKSTIKAFFTSEIGIRYLCYGSPETS
jgi:Gluconate 2-dehydrogenase subunit 3